MSALVEVTGLRKMDLINPPKSTLPPPLKLPDRSSHSNVVSYYYRVGRSYAGFYWLGVKAVWFNYKASKALRESLSQRKTNGLTRSEFQLLLRNSRDIGKLPLFGLLACIFGEYLPFLVLFIPNAVPGTCRIPKQIKDMGEKAEDRRRISFRRGIREPSGEQLPQARSGGETHMSRAIAGALIKRLQYDQLHHLSCTLGLHGRTWDRLQLPPPSALLRRRLSPYLADLSHDDYLLIKQSRILDRLSSAEVGMACEARGIDILGRREDKLRSELLSWLEHQKEDRCRGNAMLKMLFRR